MALGTSKEGQQFWCVARSLAVGRKELRRTTRGPATAQEDDPGNGHSKERARKGDRGSSHPGGGTLEGSCGSSRGEGETLEVDLEQARWTQELSRVTKGPAAAKRRFRRLAWDLSMTIQELWRSTGGLASAKRQLRRSTVSPQGWFSGRFSGRRPWTRPWRKLSF